MDSITQFALGSAVVLATVGRRSTPKCAAWKVALIGGMVGTLPDLDAFIDFGDAISNMIRHRAETHGLFYITLASPVLGWLIARFQGDRQLMLRWISAVWLILVTHVGIDLLTIYGTQILQPFTDQPFGVGSLFVIDPLYTLPLLLGVVGAVIIRGASSWRWNTAGLSVSTAYILWSLMVHQHASQVAREHPPVPNQATKVLVTASPLNTLLWRAVVMTEDAYYEGWYSLLDQERQFTWTAYPVDRAITEQYRQHPDVARVASFSHGFFRVEKINDRLYVTDLRLGLEPSYSFRFDLGLVSDSKESRSERVGVRPNLDAGLPWLWRRIKGDTSPLSVQ